MTDFSSTFRVLFTVVDKSNHSAAVPTTLKLPSLCCLIVAFTP